MADQNIIDYINEAVRRGDSRDRIKSDFISTGWEGEDAEKILDEVLGAAPAGKSSRVFLYAGILVVISVVIAAGGYYVYSAMSGYGETTVEQQPETGEQETIPEDYSFETEPSVEFNISEENVSVEENISAEEEVSEETEGDISMLANPCTETAECTAVVYGHGSSPSLAWRGSEYGLAWSYDRDGKSRLYFARLRQDGNKVGEDIVVKEYDGDAKKPMIVWTGSVYAVLWPADNSLYLVKLNPAGAISGETSIRNPGPALIESASIAWTGSGYGIAWADSNSKTYFARLDAQGNIIGEIVDIDMISSEMPSVAWAESEYGIALAEKSGAGMKIYLKRFDGEGSLISTIGVINDYIFCDDADLSWGNDNYGIAYGCIEDNTLTDPDKRDVYFMRVHSTGGKAELIELDQGMVEMTATETYSGNPSVVLAEGNYGMAWEDSRDGNREIYFGRLDPRTGTKRENEVRITSSSGDSSDPVIVRTDTEYGIAWAEEDGEMVHLWFGRVE